MNPALILFPLGLGLGMILTIHVSMNAQMSSLMNSYFAANAVFWTVGALTAWITAAMTSSLGKLSGVKDVPVWLVTSGIIGVAAAICMSRLIVKMGTARTTLLAILGQLAISMILEHYGLLGSLQRAVSMKSVLGLGIAAIGCVLVVL